MKVKCLNCGLIYKKKAWWKGGCPRCGFDCYCIEIKEEIDKESLNTMSNLAKEFLRVVKEEKIKIVKKEDVPDKTMMELTMKARDKRDRESSEKLKELLEETYFLAKSWLEEKGYMTFRKKGVSCKPVKHDKEEELAFEILEVEDCKKIKVRKIYFNGHIEGFEGNPCIVNHAYPKFLQLRAIIFDMLKQINKDYRDLIEAYAIRGLPLDQVPLHELYIREMEGINNIKI